MSLKLATKALHAGHDMKQTQGTRVKIAQTPRTRRRKTASSPKSRYSCGGMVSKQVSSA